MIVKTKLFTSKIKEIQEAERTVDHLISVEKPDRDGEILMIDGATFTGHFPVLWQHGQDPLRGSVPIGKNLELVKTEYEGAKALLARTQFADDDFSRKIFEFYRDGYLKTWSVRFQPLSKRKVENGVGIYSDWELLEYSAVAVAANPYAVSLLASKGVDAYLINDYMKRVIPYKRTPLAPEDTEWDAAAEVREATVDDLKIMCAWYDEENPDVKSSYKFPHHKARAPHPCVWRAVANAMARLTQADIPEEDIEGVYRHLVRHYEDFGKEPPELKKVFEIREKLLGLDFSQIDSIINQAHQSGGKSTTFLKKVLKGL